MWLIPLDKLNKEYAKSFNSIEDVIASLKDQAWIVEELQTLIDIKIESLSKTTRWFDVADGSEIELYGCYSADEIHLLLEDKPGRWGTSHTIQ